jgi:hypothetical protein
MQGGEKSLIANSIDICNHKRRALASFKGQNGQIHDFSNHRETAPSTYNGGGRGRLRPGRRNIESRR